jgi:hypothetical protein
MPYELTPRRLAAARANLEKAWLASRAEKAARPIRPSALKHGFYSLDLRKSVILLGEDVWEYDAHQHRLERVFRPQNAVERRVVRRLGEALWRLLRTYRTRGIIQTRKLRRLLEASATSGPLDVEQTVDLAMSLVDLFLEEDHLQQCIQRLKNQVERLLRMFLTWRTGTDQGFRVYSRLQTKDWSHVLREPRRAPVVLHDAHEQ